MANGYIPRADGLALTWMKSFVAGIASAPAAYMLFPADVASLQQAVGVFDAAYTAAMAGVTRTAGAVAAKDKARADAESLCRHYASRIKLNRGVGDPVKIALGIRPVNPTRKKIAVPASSPLLNIIGATPGCHTLRYADSTTPKRPAKPFGAVQIQLFVAVGDAQAQSPDGARLVGSFTRNPIGVDFDSADDGKVATYFGRWVSAKGEVGPWSLPVRLRVAA